MGVGRDANGKESTTSFFPFPSPDGDGAGNGASVLCC